VLLVLQKLARGNDGAIGIALVPYFNQLLPIINILKERNLHRNQRQCHVIDDYENDNLTRLIDQTFVVLEQFGGPDAFINIKYSVPTYEQQVDIKQLSTAQTNTMVRPLLEL
jgi:DNA-directed RNA polymerase III subunit RPC1